MAEAAEVNLVWLATGIGPINSDGTDSGYSEFSRIESAESDTAPAVLFRSEKLTAQGINPKDCILVSSGDEAMGSKVPYQADVLIDKTVQSGDGIYAIRISDQIVIRRLQFMLSGGVKVISENPEYEDYSLTQDEFNNIEVVGRRVWHGSF